MVLQIAGGILLACAVLLALYGVFYVIRAYLRVVKRIRMEMAAEKERRLSNEAAQARYAAWYAQLTLEERWAMVCGYADEFLKDHPQFKEANAQEEAPPRGIT
jgi:hypothetical protein